MQKAAQWVDAWCEPASTILGEIHQQTFSIEQAGLSWGSVQAKTVRLQRQSEPGLKDVHVKLTEILSQVYEGKFWIQEILKDKNQNV